MIVPPLTMTKRLDSAEARVHHGPPRLTPGTEKPPHEEEACALLRQRLGLSRRASVVPQ